MQAPLSRLCMSFPGNIISKKGMADRLLWMGRVFWVR